LNEVNDRPLLPILRVDGVEIIQRPVAPT
jgi:hypothetical protein